MTNGVYDRVDTQRSNQAITTIPTKNALIVAKMVGPQVTEESEPILVVSYSPDARTAGTANKNA